MEKKIIRLMIILMAVLFQVSVLSVIFSNYYVPNIVLVLAVAWTIHVGFVGILPWVVIAGILLDIVSFQPLGISVVALVVVAYFVSFFSRRFLVAHRAWGSLVIACFIIVVTFFYYFSSLLVAGFDDFLARGSYLFWKTACAQIISNGILFLVIYFPLKKIEDFISFYDQQIKIK